MYNEFLEYVLPIVGTALATLLSALIGYGITYINKKKEMLVASTDNATKKKYIDMVTDTITKCVQTTNSNYVDSLKKKGAFTKEAQKEAFKMTFDSVIQILTDDALDYLSEITSDVNVYLQNAITSAVEDVKINK